VVKTVQLNAWDLRREEMEHPILNQAKLSLELCEKEITIKSNETKAKELNLKITKTQSCDIFVTGSVITYCSIIKNESDILLHHVKWSDLLDERLEYVVGTFKVNGVTHNPTITTIGNRKELSWILNPIHPNSTITICFDVKVK